MTLSYIALIHKEAGSDFGVSFPDFPGCISAGGTLEEARAMAEEALALHIEGMLEDMQELPAPSSLDAIMADPENRDGVAILVPAPPGSARAVRVNITLPEDLLSAIDRHAANSGLSRSGFLASAAKQALRKAG
ncbi:type II toxin-antitoxin system HicB family antitoxin [Oceanibaculum nanhaiense]|jgi:predicted RNase H-like HicB family nuclease|uniref:type II toxin-antitoxin system HicB family antitoxin n=1 Tax=Oceanibaculum nanhaiense TaxID=1909734 RepID=UPI0032ECF19D